MNRIPGLNHFFGLNSVIRSNAADYLAVFVSYAVCIGYCLIEAFLLAAVNSGNRKIWQILLPAF